MAKAKVFYPRDPGEISDRFDNELREFFKSINDFWYEWTQYKHAQHKEVYATAMSECAAIKKLHYMSEGNPFLAEKLIEYAMGELWHGFYPPKEPGLWSLWKRQASGEIEKKIQQPQIDLGLKLLKEQAGWPEEAFKSPSWFAEESAEVKDDYVRYLVETRTFFGDLTPDNHLSGSEWSRRDFGQYGNGDMTNDQALLATWRLKMHIDFHKSGYTDIRSFLGKK